MIRTHSFHRHCYATIALMAVSVIGPLVAISLTAEEIPSPIRLTGAKFQRDLERPFSASWSRAELRDMLKDVAENRQVSIVLDRRLNPSAEYGFEAKDATLRGTLGNFAKLAKGGISVPGSFVYVGPETAAKQFRTLIELRRLDLQSKESAIPDRRRSELLRTQTVEWHDLDSPREILQKISDVYRLSVANEEQIPHDLWAGAILPESTAVESLSVVLVQFDLTFRWTDAGRSIALVPIPDQVSVIRKHPSKRKTADALAQIEQKFPQLSAKLERSEIVVVGLVEEHEAVSNLLNGHGPAQPQKIDTLPPLRQRQFTFSVEQPVPLSAVMQKLEESEIHFEYNADDLKTAGIDLDQLVQPNVKNASADEFFKSIFGPVRLDFQIDRQTVKLKPKK